HCWARVFFHASAAASSLLKTLTNPPTRSSGCFTSCCMPACCNRRGRACSVTSLPPRRGRTTTVTPSLLPSSDCARSPRCPSTAACLTATTPASSRCRSARARVSSSGAVAAPRSSSWPPRRSRLQPRECHRSVRARGARCTARAAATVCALHRSLAKAGVHPIQPAKQCWPGESAADAVRDLFPLGLRTSENVSANVAQRLPTALRAHLDHATRLEEVHRDEGLGNRSADGEQAVVTQH